MCVVPCVVIIIMIMIMCHYYRFNATFYVDQSQVTCRYIINIIMPS